MSKLLPCPFCGDAAIIDDYSTSYRPDAKPLWYVGCNNDACRLESGMCSEDQALAIELWNRRFSNHPLAQMTRLDEEMGLYDTDEKVPPAPKGDEQ